MGERDHLLRRLEEFVRELSQELAIERVILFGSRAAENCEADSDVDLIIVSDDFEGKDFFERCSKMYDYWGLDLPVDFLCYTSKEFGDLRGQISIVGEALEQGVQIK